MALSTETSKWLEDLKSSGEITDEAYTGIKTAIEASPKADQYVRESALRQSDYSREVAKAKQLQADLEAKEAKVTKYQGDLGTWKTGAEAKYLQALADQEAAQVKADAAIARLKNIALANGLSEADVLANLDSTVVPVKKETPLDTSKFVAKEELDAYVQKAALQSTFIDASLYDLGQAHQSLFGSPLPNAAQLVMEAHKSGKTLTEYWNEKFKVSEKQAEVQQANIAAKIEEGIKDGLAAKLSEHALTQGPHVGAPGNANAPVFRPEVLKPVAADHDGGGGVSAAMAAFAAGKHRQSK